MSDFNLLEHAQKLARKSAEDLDGPDNDILPVMLWVGPHGMGMLPLTLMADAKEKNTLAGWMVAALAVSRATEVTMTTTAWMVLGDDEHILDDVTPSEHPDRVEIISLVHSDWEHNTLWSAPIARYPDKNPTLGEWSSFPSDVLSGRFGTAMRRGLQCAKEMPEEMVEMVEEGWEAGRQQELVARFEKVYSTMFGTDDH